MLVCYSTACFSRLPHSNSNTTLKGHKERISVSCMSVSNVDILCCSLPCGGHSSSSHSRPESAAWHGNLASSSPGTGLSAMSWCMTAWKTNAAASDKCESVDPSNRSGSVALRDRSREDARSGKYRNVQWIRSKRNRHIPIVTHSARFVSQLPKYSHA